MKPNFWQSILWRAPFFPSLLITTLAMGLLAWAFMPGMETAPSMVIGMGFALFAIMCGGVCGLCTRLHGERLFRAVLPAIGSAAGLALATMAAAGVVLWTTGTFPRLVGTKFPPELTLLFSALSAPAFLGAQVFGWGWRWWSRLRERRFVWALTHALLSVVALLGIVALLIGMAAISYLIVSDINAITSLPPSPVYSIILRVVIWLLLLIMITLAAVIAGMLFVFPLAFLFAYRVARGMTRRIESLAAVTERVRAGDLAARVPVEGADELARLQTNFNAMGSDLETHTRELELARDRFESLLRAHRDLTANVSHELRTPVSTLSGSLDLALSHWDEQPRDVLHHDLEIMRGEVRRLEAMIDDLFTLSRAEVSRLSLHLQPVEVAPLARSLVEAVEKTAWLTRKVQVIAEIPDDLPCVQADPARLEQIIRNLLQNGLRHTPPGGFVSVSAHHAGDCLRIEVTDSGEGIAAEDLPHIWERFYRSASAEQTGDGAGLGLALVKELAEAMGAQVGVESSAGEGSAFWVDIPLAAPPAT